MVYGFKLEFRTKMWLSVMLILLGTESNCDMVEFYRKTNYSALREMYDLHSEEARNGCFVFLPQLFDVKSVKTDRCIMLFGFESCSIKQTFLEHWGKDLAYSLRVDANTPEITASLNEDGTQVINSFGVCSRDIGGGPEVDVDFYSQSNYQGEITASYRDVCGCQNLKGSAVGGKSRKISLDNHGNDIDLFEGEGCTGQKRSVRAGSYWETKWMWDPRDQMAYFDIRSFRPTNLDSCMKLSASLYKFEFVDGSKEMIDNSTEKTVKLATDSILRNNGAQSILQEYSVSGKVTAVVDVTRATGYSNMETVKTEGSVQVDVKARVPAITDGKVTAKLTASFEYKRTDSENYAKRTSVINEETVTVRQQITIQTCRECVAQTFVRKVKNFPVKYKAYSRVSGTAGAGGKRMTAKEVRLALRPEVAYLGDVDDFTVDTMVEGVMFADYGLNSFINVDCKKIADCNAAPPNPGDDAVNDKMTFVFPLQKSRSEGQEKKNDEGFLTPMWQFLQNLVKVVNN